MALDLCIRGGTLIDGTGAAARRGDIGVKDGRIVAVGQFEADAADWIDAAGLVVSPGFIDIHSHSDYTLLVDPRAVSALAQGVTLEVIGNCGFGCAPIRDPGLSAGNIYGFNGSVKLQWRGVGAYLERLAAARPAVNVLTLVPNGQLRLAAVGLSDQPADPPALATMRRLLCEGLDDGAFGFSTGLEYAPEIAATEQEITCLCQDVARYGALYATHTRYRDAGSVEAVAEALRTGAAAEVRLQVSHLLPRSGLDDGRRVMELVETAKAGGQDVAFDMHTRLYGTTFLASLLPPWARSGGPRDIAARLRDPDSRAEIKRFRSILSASGDWNRVVLLDDPRFPDYARRTLAEIGSVRGQDAHDAALDLLAEAADDLSRPMVIIHCHTEAQQREVFAHPLCMPGSDATTLAPDGPLAGSVFHGAYSWAAWFWRFMVRETRALTPEQAVFKLTGLPARTLNLSGRGVLAEGAAADIAVFAPDSFGERATTFEPNQLASGMRHVIVNGAVALRDGSLTGNRPGEVIRRTSPAMR
ncbi:MAG TPA: amidohydrolase family protein [Acetobacteraceae bacterium]